ncbi:MAG: NAD(P)H-hydrate dehydratase [Pseudomonadota bacterium]
MDRPVITPAAMRAAEARIVSEGTPGYVLMRRAGEAVAAHLQSWFPDGPVRVLCGPGGNGGDGFVAARALSVLGREVDVFCSVDRAALTGDAALAAADWSGEVHPLEAAVSAPREITLDALFGGGLSRRLSGAAAELASQNGPVVSVDVPSGLDGLTGQARGPVFQANFTVTFAGLRPAHVLVPGRALCGQVAIADIDVPIDETVGENVPADWLADLPWPGDGTHKHARGRLVVVTGGLANTGAARLAARAGLRSGAGLVTLLCPPSATLAVANQITAEMVQSFSAPEDLRMEAEDADTIIIGPAAGITKETRKNVLAALGSPARCVLDADALTVFQESPGALFDSLRETDVMTPHPGEFRRLFGKLEADSENRIEAARTAAVRAGCIVLLKGADTVIASPDGRARINTHATPWLATAGSGDVLAGVIGGLLAQGMDSFDAACAAAWMHGDAGCRFGPGLIATDLEAQLPGVLADLMALEP